MWIDYQKSYDSVPHSWVKEVLELYKVDEVKRNFIIGLIPQRRKKIKLPHVGGYVETENITFTQGIFQGDSLSPLIFALR